MKKVLICYHSTAYGGIEKQILDLISGLKNDFEFFVACPEGPLLKEYLKHIDKDHWINAYPKFEMDLKYILEISNIVKTKQIEVVLGHELLTGCQSMLGALLGGADKRIYHVHTSFLEWKHSWYKKLVSFAPNFMANYLTGNYVATDVLVLTDKIKDLRINKEKITKEKITQIYNGIDLGALHFSQDERNRIKSKYKIPASSYVIGTVGRFTEEKNQKLLIDAFEDLLKVNTHLDIYLFLAGGGKLLDSLKDYADKKDLSKKIIFTDVFEEGDRAALYSVLDIFIMPSFAEGFGIALIEAMANGRAIVASDLPVLKEVGGDSVLFFDVNKKADLVIILDRLISNPSEAKSLSKKAIERANKFSMQIFLDSYKNLFNSN